MNRRRNEKANHLGHLTLLFLALGFALVVLTAVYWLNILEPRLYDEARTNAGVLAQSHGLNLAEAVADANGMDDARELADLMDEILILNDSRTRQPFILGMSLRLDYDLVRAPPGSLDLRRGNTSCGDCFENTIPLYAPRSRELLGIARFYSSNAFFERLSSNVRTRLAIGAGVLIALLALVWGGVASLVRDLRESEAAAAAATEAKSRFLANMSHEIRTPMNAIMGSVNLLESHALSADQKHHLETIETSSEALLALIDDILDISRIEAGKLAVEPKPTDLEKLTDEALRLVRHAADQKALLLRKEMGSDVPKHVLGDACRIRQILVNLLGNAVKFTEAGTVTLRVRTAELHGRPAVAFTVVDTGIGIPADARPVVFDSFAQADASIARRYGGTGLGLAISKRLVEAMHGILEFESVEREGSTFRVTLPLPVTGEPEPARPVDKEAAGRSLTVLLAEDNDINRRVARTLLENQGHAVIEARDGDEAAEAAARQKIDVVLMDLHMPGVDGIAATRRIRQLPGERSRVPVVALTADIVAEERERCLKAGMDEVMLKPFDPKRLYETVLKLAALPKQTSAAGPDRHVSDPG